MGEKGKRVSSLIGRMIRISVLIRILIKRYEQREREQGRGEEAGNEDRKLVFQRNLGRARKWFGRGKRRADVRGARGRSLLRCCSLSRIRMWAWSASWPSQGRMRQRK